MTTALIPIGVLVAAFAVADVLVVPVARDVGPPVFVGVVVVGLLMGSIAGQAGLVTLWAAFGSHPVQPEAMNQYLPACLKSTCASIRRFSNTRANVPLCWR